MMICIRLGTAESGDLRYLYVIIESLEMPDETYFFYSFLLFAYILDAYVL